MMTSILVLGVLAFAATFIIEVLQQKLTSKDEPLIEQINRLLPQTQCAQCGYPGCRPYAQAIVRDEAPIDLCPPGGERTVGELESLLDKRRQGTIPIDSPPLLAHINEDDCIGCSLCIAACPVDAIIGTPQWMHTVLYDRCTGCELCLPPCPVDCIDMEVQKKGTLTPPADHPIPCIHCNACTIACPVSLNVKNLFLLTAKEQIQQAESIGLAQCIECEVCDTVCPSEIPLTSFFRYAHSRSSELAQWQNEALTAQQRFEAHTMRIEGERQQKKHAIHKQKELLKHKIQQKPVPKS